MTEPNTPLTILHGKFSTYLSWSQPFIHNLVSGIGEHVNNVVLCNRTENLDWFPTPNVCRIATRYLVSPALSVLAAAYLQKIWRPDVMHAHFGWSGVRMLLLKQFLRIPMVTTFGGRDVGVQMHQPHLDRLYRILLDASDLIICVSEDLRQKVLDVGVSADRIEVIRRGVDLNRFSFVDRTDRDPAGSTRILMVGRLVKKKGHSDAFCALHWLVREGCEFNLTIVGDGAERQRLRRMRDEFGLRDRITFAGLSDHNGVRQHMRDADVFLHCSVTESDGDCEGIPNCIVEAAATGLPVVATRHGGIVEPVRHNLNGLLVAEHDVDGLRDALKQVITNRDVRLQLGRSGRELMESEFDFDQHVVARHLAIYERLAADYADTPARRTRMWIPRDFPRVVQRLKLYEDITRELTIDQLAHLTDSILGCGTLDLRFLLIRPTLLDRAYNLRRRLPKFVKRPLKMILGRPIEMLWRWRNRKRLAAQHLLDLSVLTYFRKGGSLETMHDEWDAAGLERLLSGDQRRTWHEGASDQRQPVRDSTEPDELHAVASLEPMRHEPDELGLGV